MRISSFFFATSLLALCAGQIAAQNFDTNGPHAILTVQKSVASVVDPIDHDVPIFVPGQLDIDVDTPSNPNQRLILLGSILSPTGAVFPVPWGGSVDIGVNGSPLPTSIDVIGDGINFSTGGPIDAFMATDSGDLATGRPPRFDFDLTAPDTLDGLHYAVQAIVTDPTAMLQLDMTEAADLNFQLGQKLFIDPGQLGTANVGFLSGRTFDFHGVTYSDIYINSKGILSFGVAPTYAPAGFNNDSVLFTTGVPAIAGWIADWGDQGPNEGLLYEEIGTTARIAWGDPEFDPTGIDHFFGSDSNQFQIRLELQSASAPNPLAGEFAIDIVQTDDTATSQNGDGIIGHTPGAMVLTGIPGEVDLHGNAVSLANEAQIEEHNASGTATVLGYDGMGTPRAYNSIHSWNGQSVTFSPNPFITNPGDSGYFTTASAQAVEDVTGFDVPSLMLNGGQIVNLVGKFHNFNDALGLGGSIVFDPNGAALPAVINGILDGTGALQPNITNNPATSPFRDGEAIEIVTPNFSAAGLAAGPMDVQVTFDSGVVITRTVQVISGTSLFTSYPLSQFANANLQSAAHTLAANTITYYGQTYTNFWISRYGYITFGAAASDFSESLPETFAGIQTPPTMTPNPVVAVIYTDLNNPSNTGATFEVTEDFTTGTTMVEFNNQDHWVTQNPAGGASVTFGTMGPGSLTFDHTNFIPDPMPGSGSQLHDLIIGVSNGDSTTGTDNDLSNGAGTGFSSVIGTYSTVSAPESVLELIPINITPGVSTLPGPGTWSMIDTGDGMTTPFGSWVIF